MSASEPHPVRPKPPPDYLSGYPAALTDQVQQLIAQEKLAERLLQKYPVAHGVRTNRALYDYVLETKNTHMRNTGPLNKVIFDSTLHVARNALGTHTRVPRAQGDRLKTHREIRIATVFREMPPEFLRMIVVHELAHLKEGEHNKAFYQLCLNMEAEYHQLEFDLRCYLSWLEATGRPLWQSRITS